jgi:hypothetical protein
VPELGEDGISKSGRVGQTDQSGGQRSRQEARDRAFTELYEVAAGGQRGSATALRERMAAMGNGQDAIDNHVPGTAGRLTEAEFRELYAGLRAPVPWGPR